ncbi:MAG: hypothetical protein ACXWLM_06590 [Myxococcales bacterium]
MLLALVLAMITDDIFWSADPAAAVAKAAPAREGLELFAPASVDLAARQTLPVVLRRRVSVRDDMIAPLPFFGALVALDLDADEAFAGRARAPHDDARPFRPPDPRGLEKVMPGMTTQPLAVDLRAALALPWHAARLRLFGVAAALRSEPVEVTLAGAGSAQAPREEQIEPSSRKKDKLSPPAPGIAAKGRKVLVTSALQRDGFVHLVFCPRERPGAPIVRRVRSAAGEGHFTVDAGKLDLGGSHYFVWAVTRDGVFGPAEVSASAR